MCCVGTTAFGFERTEGQGGTVPFSAIRSSAGSAEAAPGGSYLSQVGRRRAEELAGGKQLQRRRAYFRPQGGGVLQEELLPPLPEQTWNLNTVQGYGTRIPRARC